MSARKEVREHIAIVGDCWHWTGAIDPKGYGRAGGGMAHRRSYEESVGPVPDGLDLDHVCHTSDDTCPGGPACMHRRCVNPDHLEPVTRRENILRGRGLSAEAARRDCCSHGHPYTPANTRIHNGTRLCRACDRRRQSLMSMRRLEEAS